MPPRSPFPPSRIRSSWNVQRVEMAVLERRKRARESSHHRKNPPGGVGAAVSPTPGIYKRRN